MTARFWFNALCVALGLVLFWVWGNPMFPRALAGENDFLQLYAGARLVGTPDLYNIEASKAIHREVTRAHTYFPSVYYTRLPYYALLLKPLGGLPYHQAYLIYQCISVTIFLGFLALYVRIYPELITFAALSVPLLINFINGQDAGMATAFAGFAIYLEKRGKGFLGGLILSLATIKFHLFFLVAIAVLVHRKWDLLRGALTGGAVLFVLSVIADGIGWPVRFLAMVRNPELHPGPEHMTTFRNLACLISGGENNQLEMAFNLALAALFVYLAWKIKDFTVTFGLALVGGLVICHHAYSQDLLVLLLAVALFATSPASKYVRGLTMLAALPPTAFILFSGFPYSAAVPLLLTSILLTALVFDAHQSPGSAPAGN